MFWKKTAHREVRQGLKKLFPRLWRYCLILTGSTDWAADLAQSVCVRALERSDQYSVNTELDRWLFRIAKNIWLNELRAEAVRQGGGIYQAEELALPESTSSPEINAMNKDLLQGVLLLPEAQRVVVGLVYIEGYSYSEAAETLDIPVGTVMSRLSTARSKLSKRFKHYQSDVV